MIVANSVLLRMKIFFRKNCRENQTYHFILNFVFNLAAYEVKWKKNLKPDRSQITTGGMQFACWLSMATNTSSEYVNLLTPNDHYSGRTAPLTFKIAFYIFIQQI